MNRQDQMKQVALWTEKPMVTMFRDGFKDIPNGGLITRAGSVALLLAITVAIGFARVVVRKNK